MSGKIKMSAVAWQVIRRPLLWWQLWRRCHTSLYTACWTHYHAARQAVIDSLDIAEANRCTQKGVHLLPHELPPCCGDYHYCHIRPDRAKEYEP